MRNHFFTAPFSYSYFLIRFFRCSEFRRPADPNLGYGLPALIRMIQEGHDLRPGTVEIGAKQSAADAGSDSVFGRPGHSLCVVGVRLHIREFCTTADSRTVAGTIEEGDRLRSCTGCIWRELPASRAARNAVFGCPGDGLLVVSARCYVVEALRSLRLGTSGPGSGTGRSRSVPGCRVRWD